MTALLADAEIEKAAIRHSDKDHTPFNSDARHHFKCGARFARSIYEARLAKEREQRDAVIEENARNAYAAIAAAKAEDAKVRAELVEALEAVKASWTNNDPLRAQHILQINDALASAKLLA